MVRLNIIQVYGEIASGFDTEIYSFAFEKQTKIEFIIIINV